MSPDMEEFMERTNCWALATDWMGWLWVPGLESLPEGETKTCAWTPAAWTAGTTLPRPPTRATRAASPTVDRVGNLLFVISLSFEFEAMLQLTSSQAAQLDQRLHAAPFQ